MSLSDDSTTRTSSYSTKMAVLVGLCVFVCALSVMVRLESSRQAALEERIQNTSRDHAARLEKSMDRTLAITYALAALVHQYHGRVVEFERVGQALLPLFPGADVVMIQPGGVVTQVVPREHNISRLGYDVLKDPLRRDDALLAIASRQLTLGGPYLQTANRSKETQDTVGRYPVYLEDITGTPVFWGFTAVTVNVADVVKRADLLTLEQRGMAYRIWRAVPEAPDGRLVIASSSAPLEVRPVSETISMAGATWIIDVAPTTGWFSWWTIVLECLFALLFSVMSGILIKLLFEARRHAHALEKVANYDPLTALPNRRLLLQLLRDAMEHASASGEKVSVCYMDLDQFKPINDTHGHEAGDFLLTALSHRFQESLRASDTVARVGGDEFVMILRHIQTREQVDDIIERLMALIETPVLYEGHSLQVSASIGVAIYPDDHELEERLLRHADAAMYQSKRHESVLVPGE